MEIRQKEFLEILNHSIRGLKVDKDIEKQDNWDEIFEYSRIHNTHGLIYSSVEKLKKFQEWKKEVFFTGLYQKKNIQQISRVLKLFNEAEIPVIALKGLIIRNLYPIPELRTMVDADLLVKSEDLQKVREILLEKEYTEITTEAEHHLVFKHEKYMSIEIHWQLSNSEYFKKELSFEKEIWKNAVKKDVAGEKYLSLCYEDMVVYLCAHMATHIAYTGFKLRQISDLVLLVEKEGKGIDWKKVAEISKDSDLEKMVHTLFALAHRLFKMPVPQEIEELSTADEEILKFLTEYAFAGKPPETEKEILTNTLKGYIPILFPTKSNIPDEYSYGKKNSVLLPVAWAHRIGTKLLKYNGTIIKKIGQMNRSADAQGKKRSMLKKLEI